MIFLKKVLSNLAMSFNQNEYVINPNTGKPVKKGTRAYNNLIREGIVSDEQVIDKKIMYKIKKEDTEEDIQMKKEEIDKDLNETEDESYQAVKGRGVHKDTLVKRHKPPPTNKVMRKTVKVIQDKKNEVDTTEYNELEKRILKLLDSDTDDE